MPTLKLSDLGRSKIEQARIEQGWTSDDPRWLVKASKILEPSGEWCEGGPYACGCSEGTLKRFRRGKPVNTDTFKAFCEASKLVWQDVIEEFSINSLNDNHFSDGKTFQNPSKKLLDQMGSAHIGSIDLPDGNSMPIVLDVKELVRKCLFSWAKVASPSVKLILRLQDLDNRDCSGNRGWVRFCHARQF